MLYLNRLRQHKALLRGSSKISGLAVVIQGLSTNNNYKRKVLESSTLNNLMANKFGRLLFNQQHIKILYLKGFWCVLLNFKKVKRLVKAIKTIN
tara:strand:- start:1185 stop:1466 length:282 start_codon:yes stop_codon:yes gene_type:complete